MPPRSDIDVTMRDEGIMTNHPRIGIRPTIDGRRKGVRESLEEQTMNMAKSVAELFTSNLRYPDGSPVEVVIADTTIGRVHEAQACAAKFRANNVGLTLTVTPCWCYGTETTDMDPAMPHAIWGFNGTERPGAVYLAAALAGHAQIGIPAFGIYGEHVQDADDTSIPEDVRTRLLDYATDGLAVAQMKGEAYLSMGSVSMGIAGSVVNPDFFGSYLGMRNEYIDMSEFTRRIDEGIYDPEEDEKAYQWIRENFKQGKDWNPPEWQYPEKHEDWWKFVTKMTIIARDLMHGNPRLAELGFEEEAGGHGAIAAGFQGQRQWTDHFPNGDVLETILNTNFDWTGIRQHSVVATENDSLNGASMLFGYLLTNTPQIFSDEATLEATTFHPASTGYFRGGGFSTHFRTSGEMPVTMCRINLVRGLGPVMQIAEGYTVELPDEVAFTIEERTNIEWPTTWFVPNLTGEGAFKSVYDVMNNWGANHGAISYGHIGGQLITLASMLRIPVNMHNVPEERVFRPKAWSLFGTESLEAADFRACETFGPMYR